MNEEDSQKFMRHLNTMVACDSGLRKLGEAVSPSWRLWQ